MSNLTLQQRKKIRDGAPDGATHTDGTDYFRPSYYQYTQFDIYDEDDEEWMETGCSPDSSLADNDEIIALHERVEKLESELKEVVEACLNPTAVDFVRCGIASNYSGKYYDGMIQKVHKPIADLYQHHRMK